MNFVGIIGEVNVKKKRREEKKGGVGGNRQPHVPERQTNHNCDPPSLMPAFTTTLALLFVSDTTQYWHRTTNTLTLHPERAHSCSDVPHLQNEALTSPVALLETKSKIRLMEIIAESAEYSMFFPDPFMNPGFPI